MMMMMMMLLMMMDVDVPSTRGSMSKGCYRQFRCNLLLVIIAVPSPVPRRSICLVYYSVIVLYWNRD